MATPFIIDQLMQVNPNMELVEQTDDYIVFDNFYSNYEQIYSLLEHIPAPAWKYNTDDTRNFIDYYDCRPVLPWATLRPIVHIEALTKIIRDTWKERANIVSIANPVEFNFFKSINVDVIGDRQMFPHVDNDYTAIIYMDKVCDGGTAFYTNCNPNKIPYTEQDDLFVDVSMYEKHVVQSKPNRLVLFRGQAVHGGYVNDYNSYKDTWRMNQVVFFAYNFNLQR